MLTNANANIDDTGFICFSQNRKNHVSSNVIGAAAYAGKRIMLEYLIKRVGKRFLEFRATEKQDI